jgi:Flp pilus assembly protein TadD
MSPRRSIGFLVIAFLALLAASAAVVPVASPSYDLARKLYNSTEFEQSLKVLDALPTKDGAAWELIGRNHYMQADYKKASDALEKAVSANPQNSEYALWLGRAYGRRAETSSPFTAPGLANKARHFFETAVQLNPRNLDALTDLFEYYLEAPGFLGGGSDKAQGLVNKIAVVDPAEGAWTQAKLAEKRKEMSSAEDHLRRAIELSPRQVGRFIDLARFLAKQGRFQESDQSLERAEKVSPNAPKLVFARADLYIKHGRNLEVAKDLLKQYLSMNLSPDDPPRAQAEKLLRQVRGS